MLSKMAKKLLSLRPDSLRNNLEGWEQIEKLILDMRQNKMEGKESSDIPPDLDLEEAEQQVA